MRRLGRITSWGSRRLLCCPSTLARRCSRLRLLLRHRVLVSAVIFIVIQLVCALLCCTGRRLALGGGSACAPGGGLLCAPCGKWWQVRRGADHVLQEVVQLITRQALLPVVPATGTVSESTHRARANNSGGESTHRCPVDSSLAPRFLAAAQALVTTVPRNSSMALPGGAHRGERRQRERGARRRVPLSLPDAPTARGVRPAILPTSSSAWAKEEACVPVSEEREGNMQTPNRGALTCIMRLIRGASVGLRWLPPPLPPAPSFPPTAAPSAGSICASDVAESPPPHVPWRARLRRRLARGWSSRRWSLRTSRATRACSASGPSTRCALPSVKPPHRRPPTPVRACSAHGEAPATVALLNRGGAPVVLRARPVGTGRVCAARRIPDDALWPASELLLRGGPQRQRQEQRHRRAAVRVRQAGEAGAWRSL
jgi:hypothetical protein